MALAASTAEAVPFASGSPARLGAFFGMVCHGWKKRLCDFEGDSRVGGGTKSSCEIARIKKRSMAGVLFSWDVFQRCHDLPMVFQCVVKVQKSPQSSGKSLLAGKKA